MLECVIKLQYGLTVASISRSAKALLQHYKRQTVPAIINKSPFNNHNSSTHCLSMPGASGAQVVAATAGITASDVPIFAVIKHIAQVSQ